MAAASWAVGQSPAADSTRLVTTTSMSGPLESAGERPGCGRSPPEHRGLEDRPADRKPGQVETAGQEPRKGLVQGQGEPGMRLERGQGLRVWHRQRLLDALDGQSGQVGDQSGRSR